MRPVSDCHAASLEEAGADHTITYWVCRECNEPCGPAENAREGPV